MFTLAQYTFRKLLLNSQSLNVFILGLESAGKTCLLNELKRQYEKKEPVTVIPTIGKNNCRFKEKGIEYNFQDVGGSATLRKYWHKFYNEIDALLYVIDGSSSETEMEESFSELRNMMAERDLDGVPICVCINKLDIAAESNGCLLSKEDFQAKFKIEGDCLNRKFTVIETVLSSKQEAVYWGKKRRNTRFGAQSKEQLQEEEEEKNSFPLHIHRGAADAMLFLDTCIRTDATTKKRIALTRKLKKRE